MARAVDSDWLWFQVVSAFDEEAKAEYQASYSPGAKWTDKPWYFQDSRPLGGFFRDLEPRLAQKVPALADFRIPKGAADLDQMLSQPMSQAVQWVYGSAIKFLAKAPDVKLG